MQTRRSRTSRGSLFPIKKQDTYGELSVGFSLAHQKKTTGMVPVVVNLFCPVRCSAGEGSARTPSARGLERVARQRQLREHPAEAGACPGTPARGAGDRGATLRTDRAVNGMGHETSFQKQTTISGRRHLTEGKSRRSREFHFRDGPDKCFGPGALANAGSGGRACAMRLRRNESWLI
jgi:hypothetical protein